MAVVLSLPRPTAGRAKLSGCRRDLLAAAAVEAACGVAAAAWTNAWHSGHNWIAVFAACTVAAAAADMVLVPGCVWARRPGTLVRLLCRTLAVPVTLVIAVAIAVAIALFFNSLVFTLQVATFGLPTADSAWLALWVIPFMAGGMVAGFAAWLAEASETRPGLVQTRCWAHVAGGGAGMALVLAVALASYWVGPSGSGTWWPLLVLMPAALVIGGGLRNVLMARDALRTGTALADGPVTLPALVCCAAALAVAATAFAPATLAGAAP